MGSVADAAFDAFVDREHEALLRLARLLEEDPRDADAVVRTALARVRRRWRTTGRRGDPAAAARAAIVRQVLRGRSAGPRTSGWVDDFEAAWDADDSGELRGALAELPGRTRVATVLATWAGLPDAEVAALLRDTPEAVRAEVTAGTARLGSVLAPVRLAWHPGPPDTGLVSGEDLARRLDALADEAVPAGTAAVLAGTARRDARTVRRRWAVGAVAACVAVAVAVPLLGGSPAPAAPAAAPGTPRKAPAPPPVDLTQLPARGSLAGDEVFLAALRELPWQTSEEWGMPEEFLPRPEDRRVLFAGDVPGGRWALVAGPPPRVGSVPSDSVELGEETVTMWFTGPPGARPEEMVASSYPYGAPQGLLRSLVDPRTGTMVVLAAPGDVVEISARPEIAADGSRSRTWERVESEDGVAVTRLPTTGQAWSWATTFRLVGADPEATTAMSGWPESVLTEDQQQMPRSDVVYPSGRPPAGQRETAENAAGSVLTQLGLSPDDVETTALLTASMPAPAAGTVALIAVRVPSGAVVVTGAWGQVVPGDVGGGGSLETMGECGTDVRPAGLPVTERVVAAACDVWDPVTGGSRGSVLLVSAPRSVAAVRVYEGNGDYFGEHALVDGRLVLPLDRAVAEVEAVTADGVLLGRSDLLQPGDALGV